MTDVAADALRSIRESAEEEQGARNSMTRVTVQVGHCSLAVGADEVVEAVRETLPGDAYLATAGCDGACFAGPKLSINVIGRTVQRILERVGGHGEKGLRFPSTDGFT